MTWSRHGLQLLNCSGFHRTNCLSSSGYPFAGTWESLSPLCQVSYLSFIPPVFSTCVECSQLPLYLLSYFCPWGLYWNLIAIVTNYHKRHDLKSYKFIIWWCWRSEVQNQSPWPKIKLLQGWILEFIQRKKPFLVPFLAPTGCLHSLAHDLTSTFKASREATFSWSLSLSPTLSPSLTPTSLQVSLWLHWTCPDNPG